MTISSSSETLPASKSKFANYFCSKISEKIFNCLFKGYFEHYDKNKANLSHLSTYIKAQYNSINFTAFDDCVKSDMSTYLHSK